MPYGSNDFEHYMKESMGYWQYAARSNFIGFLLFLVIVSSYYYAKTLQRLPTDYPYLWIVLLVLVPLLSSSPIRTLVRKADRMFLLRIEHEMGAYFRSSFMYSLSMQGFWTIYGLGHCMRRYIITVLAAIHSLFYSCSHYFFY